MPRLACILFYCVRTILNSNACRGNKIYFLYINIFFWIRFFLFSHYCIFMHPVHFFHFWAPLPTLNGVPERILWRHLRRTEAVQTMIPVCTRCYSLSPWKLVHRGPSRFFLTQNLAVKMSCLILLCVTWNQNSSMLQTEYLITELLEVFSMLSLQPVCVQQHGYLQLD